MRIVDLFAGIGGIRKGLELALDERGIPHSCVFTSEIKPHAIEILKQNHPNEIIHGDITLIDENELPDFDILCAGFPCQAFSYAGLRKGFADTRGTLFFDVERILKAKQPMAFILENVEGLVNHDKGKTFKTICSHLEALDYQISYKVLNSVDFGIPQDRKRIYIVGSKTGHIDLENFPVERTTLSSILEQGKPISKSRFVDLLLKRYKPEELFGKSIKDKRGGESNIHSWDIDLKGHTTIKEKKLLNQILKERRKHKWAERYGITWMDGMPLTYEFITEFFHDRNLKQMLDKLVDQGYLVLEHPKKQVLEPYVHRVYDESLPKGYNIVTGKLSFEISKILDPNSIAPTLVAMDMQKLYVVDNGGVRRLTHREGLRLFGYPEDFCFDIKEKEGFDLLGNTVVVPVIKAVAHRLIDSFDI